MNNETNLLEKNYEFKISFVTFFKDFFGTSKGDEYVEKVDSKVKEVMKNSDITYIENLEKGMKPVIETEKKNRKRNIQAKEGITMENSIHVKENTTEISDNGENELSL